MNVRRPFTIPSKWTLLIFGALSVACFSLSVIVFNLPRQISYAKQIPTAMNQAIIISGETQKTQAVPDLPVRLKIPSIHVDATLEHVGLNILGEVGVPKGPTNAAWFNLSARPGEIGSAILVGHFGRWKNGIPTVFNHLDALKKGDQIFVEDQKGSVITFIVRDTRTYSASENVPEVFGVNDDHSHLNLITCEGIWNRILKRYPKRLVVFADKQ
ncbi:MAG: class F sortase [Candidatus Uhrbacteria bacterium]|nr:class F sortase [Candidatus Uhrbacteria bacterium]